MVQPNGLSPLHIRIRERARVLFKIFPFILYGGTPTCQNFLRTLANFSQMRYNKRMNAPHIDDKRLIRRICRKIEDGIHPPTAARACGVSAETFYRWLRMGEDDPNSKYAEVVSQFSQADARAEITIASRLIEASKDDWKAAESVLKRRFPNWADRQTTRIEQTTQITGTVNIAQQLAEAGVIDAITDIFESELELPAALMGDIIDAD